MLENVSKETLLTYGAIYYLIYSIGGLYFMSDYVRRCRLENCLPFNNSVLKGFFMLIFCGLFTKLILLFGIISTFFDLFRKKG
jgi:hypothetical protein